MGEPRTADQRERLALLVRAGELFHRSLELEETLSNVARMAVESFAHLCLVDLIDEVSGQLYVSVGAHRDPSVEVSLKALVTPLLRGESRGLHPARRVAQSAVPFFAPVLDAAAIRAHAASDEHEAFMRRMGYRSKIVVPVIAQLVVFGTLTFVRTDGAPPFDELDVQAAIELGRRAGLAVANAKRYKREQHVAETLQSAFLNDRLPHRPTHQFHALYRGGESGPDLGGDWYDAFEVGDSTVMTVGDVTGKGVDAARRMVQLRQWVRLAAIVSLDPGTILDLLNRGLLAESDELLATAFVGVLQPDAKSLHYASAGHPPPLLRCADGRVLQLAEANLPLGAVPDAGYTTSRVSLHDASLLAMYTDGLTEIDRDPVAGEARLVALLEDEAVMHVANPARYLERALERRGARDDLAIMTLRLAPSGRQWRFDVGDSAAAYAIKADLLRALAEASVPQPNMVACELIFSELIGNAVRYAPGPLSLSLSREDGALRLHVIDEGPGITATPALPRDLWSESGRGLFLVAALSHGLEIRRLPGYGSHLVVRLPLAERGDVGVAPGTDLEALH